MSDEEFDAVIEGAYAEPLMITGAIGDDALTEVAPTPSRPGVDRGIAGSLVQTRDRLRTQRRADRGPVFRDRITLIACAVLLACAMSLGVVVGGARIPGPGAFTVLLGVVAVAGLAGFSLVPVGALRVKLG